MKYSNFEDLPVWQAAIQFALKVFEFTNKADFRGFGDTKNQLERAAVSVSNNIAEGFERGTTVELIYFLYISKGSSGECKSMLRMCEQAGRFSDFRSEISDLIDKAQSVSRQLNGWIESLKNSNIKGPKFLTNKEREKAARDKEFEEFDKQMEDFRQQHLAMLKKREEDYAAERRKREAEEGNSEAAV